MINIHLYHDYREELNITDYDIEETDRDDDGVFYNIEEEELELWLDNQGLNKLYDNNIAFDYDNFVVGCIN